MLNIEQLKFDIIKKLKHLKPDKIILFGSYAYGTPTEESDIDLFIMKNIKQEDIRTYKLKVRKEIRDLISKYRVGFDILVAPESFVKSREDYFYKVDILQNGKIIYE